MVVTSKKTVVAKKKVIFIIEDDSFLIKAYQVKFAKENAEIWVAADGSEALEFLKKDPPSVVLLDLMLPGVSGFDVLAAIKGDAKWKKTPVIVLTNLGQTEDKKRCEELGIDDYIIKANTKINEVAEKVKKYL
ncbi:response regulator [Candidatus Falkowbacteria bacterium]|nr:response regulator [Candidatus Falkowbacteria bacterium]